MHEFTNVFTLLIALVFALAPLFIVIWAYNDAEQRGQSGCLIALLIIFTNWIGLIIWLILRNNLPTAGQPVHNGGYIPPRSQPQQSPGLVFFHELNRVYLNWKAGQITDTEFRISKDELIDHLEHRQVRQDPDKFLAELIPFIEYGVLTQEDINRIRSIIRL